MNNQIHRYQTFTLGTTTDAMDCSQISAGCFLGRVANQAKSTRTPTAVNAGSTTNTGRS